MAKEGGITRATVIGLMKGAIEKGQSASSFIKDMQSRGLSYRRQLMLSDWRTVGDIKVKEDRIKYVRKDRLPSADLIAKADWNLSREFMYKVRVQSRLEPGKPIEEQWINILSDRPLTPGQVEADAYQLYASEYVAERGTPVSVVASTVIQRVGL